MRLIFFILAIAFAAGRNVFAQPVAVPQLKLKTAGGRLAYQPMALSTLPSIKADSATWKPLSNRLPLDFYSQHLGAACKMELQLEKQTKLPIRIRLGSKEQVDYLEGKFSRNR